MAISGGHVLGQSGHVDDHNLLDTAIAGKSGTAHTHDGRYIQTVNGIVPDASGDVSVSSSPDPAGIRDIVATADLVAPLSSEVLGNDTALKFTMAANETWDVDLFVLYQADATVDMKAAVDIPTGATIFGDARGLSSAAAGSSGSSLLATITGDLNVFTFAGIGDTVTTSARFSFRVANGATAGDVQFQFAQGTTNATLPVRLKAGRSLLAVRK